MITVLHSSANEAAFLLELFSYFVSVDPEQLDIYLDVKPHDGPAIAIDLKVPVRHCSTGLISASCTFVGYI